MVTKVDSVDTGAFDNGKYFDVFAEYAKENANDILVKITIGNRGKDDAVLHLLPTIWVSSLPITLIIMLPHLIYNCLHLLSRSKFYCCCID